jgi:protein TonB
MPPRAVPLELPPEPSEPAENFIPLEEPGSTAEIAAPPVPGELSKTPEESAAETAAYVKRNYDYIQRRIRGTLEYPIQALRAGAQGVVEVSFILHKDGGVSEVGIAASSGFELLDAAAMEAIYAAAPFRRPPAEVRMVIPVAFRLR